jgi:truncated hemoglobin YjbI
MTEKQSLYDRLGGVKSIAPVVDALIDRVMVDPRLKDSAWTGRDNVGPPK